MMEAGVAKNEGDTGRVRLHLTTGWCLIATFMILGTTLELMHALKLGWYLDLANETRRLLMRLAHAHGVLLGILNICFALTIPHRSKQSERAEVRISRCVLFGSILLPAGFLLGGLIIYGGDPNPSVALSPIGAILLVVGVLSIAWSLLSARAPSGHDRSGGQR